MSFRKCHSWPLYSLNRSRHPNSMHLFLNEKIINRADCIICLCCRGIPKPVNKVLFLNILVLLLHLWNREGRRCPWCWRTAGAVSRTTASAAMLIWDVMDEMVTVRTSRHLWRLWINFLLSYWILCAGDFLFTLWVGDSNVYDRLTKERECALLRETYQGQQ